MNYLVCLFGFGFVFVFWLIDYGWVSLWAFDLWCYLCCLCFWFWFWIALFFWLVVFIWFMICLRVSDLLWFVLFTGVFGVWLRLFGIYFVVCYCLLAVWIVCLFLGLFSCLVVWLVLFTAWFCLFNISVEWLSYYLCCSCLLVYCYLLLLLSVLCLCLFSMGFVFVLVGVVGWLVCYGIVCF